MTPQELKTSILWNAIQGKLTIQAMGENATNLMKNGLLPEPNIEEQYFDIPANWRWCRIKDLFALVNGKAFKPSDWGTTGIPIVRIQNLNDPAAPYNYFSGDIEDKYVLHGGELLFSWSGTPGTSFGSYIWHGNKAVLNQHIFIVSPQIELDVQYAMYALNAELTVFIEKAHGGAGLKHITKKEFESCGLPIPPLAEQKRIVAKIEELLPLVERYAAAYEKLEQFNAKFPEDMKKSILQYAIQGKLVKQRAEEGTGEELYQQIQAEKQHLIAEKKIKKEKPLAEIAEDEIPFDIPESWKWVRWGNLSFSIQYGYNAPAKQAGRIKMVRISDIQNGKVIWDSVPFCDIRDEDLPTYLLEENDILFARTGGTVGKSYIVKEIPEEAIYAGYLIRTRYSDMLCPEYLYYFMQTQLYWIQLRNGTIATAQPNCNGQTLSKMILPLPPLAEQKRIVAKIEELLPLCERLK